MPYSSRAELPESVREALPEHAQDVWRAAFNEAAPDQGEESAFRIAWAAVTQAGYEKGEDGTWHKVAKALEAARARWGWGRLIAKASAVKGWVFGWAGVYVQDGALVEDAHGDLVDPDTVEQAFYDYTIRKRAGGEEHAGDAPSQLIESVVFTPEKVAAMFGGAEDPVIADADAEDLRARLEALASAATVIGWLQERLGVRTWVGYQVTPETAAKVQTGELGAFSIQGYADEVPVEAHQVGRADRERRAA